MFKWLKTKISNLFNRFQAWKRRHPVLTATTALSLATFAVTYTIAVAFTAVTVPVQIPLSMALLITLSLLHELMQFYSYRMEQMNVETFNNARLIVV